MSKQYIHIETSYESIQPGTKDELHDFIIEINYPENLNLLGAKCKNRNIINQNPQACEMIASWLRLFGIFTILDKSDQDPTRPIALCLSDGADLVIDGWDILDEERKNTLIKNNSPDSDLAEDDVVHFIYEYTDTMELSLVNESVDPGIQIAARNSNGNHYDLVLRPDMSDRHTYAHYTGTYGIGESIINLIASDLALLPSVKVTDSNNDIRKYITFNALEFFKNSDDAMCTESDAYETFVQFDITETHNSTIVMDYIELQAVNINQNLFAFYGNDPRF